MNCAQLDTLISVSPENLAKRGEFDARRALAKIARAQGVELAAIPSEQALARLEQIKGTLLGKEFGNVRPNLARALALEPLPLDVLDRIRRGEQTLADALLAVERQPTLATTGRVPGALRLFAETLKLRPEEIPATIAFVEEKFAAWSPTLLHLSGENFTNFRWRVRRGVGLVDLAGRQHRKLSRLTGAWAELAAKIRPPGRKRRRNGSGLECWLAKLADLIAHCEPRGIAPEAVTDDTIKALHADLNSRGVADPFERARNTVYAWEVLQRAVAGFPQQKLSRLYCRGFQREHVHSIPYQELPECFRQSFDEYVAGHFGPHGIPTSFAELVPDDEMSFAEMAESLDTPIAAVRRSDAAVPNYRTVLTYAANAMLAMGGTPETVSDVATPEILARVLDAIWAGQQARGTTAKKNGYLYNAANIVITVARDGGLPPAQIERMILLRDRVDPHFIKYVKGPKRDGSTGLVRVRSEWRIGPRHAERLRQFNDPNVFRAWFQLPYILLDGVKRAVDQAKASKAQLHREIINDAIVALYHGVARCAPVRRENFAQMRCDGREVHLDLPKTPGTAGYIVVPEEFTKNNKRLTIELFPLIADWFRSWMAEVRPRCAGATKDNPYVFPSDAGGHRNAGDINKLFVDRNWKRGGFKLNTQVCRHVTAKIILDRDPSKMPLVQTLLAHASLKTTETYYGQVNQIIAQRWYQGALEAVARDLGVEAF